MFVGTIATFPKVTNISAFLLMLAIPPFLEQKCDIYPATLWTSLAYPFHMYKYIYSVVVVDGQVSVDMVSEEVKFRIFLIIFSVKFRNKLFA